MESSDFFIPPTSNNPPVSYVVVGESGFNILYNFEREGKRFAAKALRGEFRGKPLYEALLRKEFEISYLLDHPNICRTHSFEILDNIGNAIVMEWLDGRTLEQFIKQGNHNVKQLQRIAEQLCDALSYAHKRQIIHRDLKPQNIIITHNGDNVKLLDFGLSDTDFHTSLKEPAGSRKYASPELMRGGVIDSRSDVYSLGVLVDELFEGHKTSKISRVVARATSFYPSSRYASVEMLRSDLQPRVRRGVFYYILVAILILIAYLFYNLNQTQSSLVPSSKVDRVSVSEFERREALSNEFYRKINASYLELMNENIYKTSCANEKMPNFNELSNRQLAIYDSLLDSLMGDIKKSSLYLLARRNRNSYNSELFTIMQSSFPATFWINTEQLYRDANDTLALRLKKLPAPKLAANYAELSYAEQQNEQARYNNAEKEYKKSTVKIWAEQYRKVRGFEPLSKQLLD